MKRRIMLKLAVFLLLGAIINVAVAWGCALWQLEDVYPVDLPRTVAQDLRKEMLPELSADRCMSTDASHDSAFGRYTRRVVVAYKGDGFEESGIEEWHLRQKEWCGYPFLSLNGHATCVGTAIETRRSALHGLLRPKWLDDGRGDEFFRAYILPLMPAWPGFVINTIFYATILWLLAAAPFKLRRFIRMKRHRCPGCGYPVGTLGGPVCTECGKPVTPLFHATSPPA